MSDRSSSSSLRGVPLTIALLVAVIVTLAMLVMRARENAPQARGEALVAPIEELRPDAGDSFVPDLPRVPDLATDRARGVTEPPRDPEGDALAQEMRLVHEARLQLERDPAAALDLLEQHRARFPSGALAEEREAHAILAMVLTGAPQSEVERRFADLLADHPQTSFAPAIRDAIAHRE